MSNKKIVARNCPSMDDQFARLNEIRHMVRHLQQRVYAVMKYGDSADSKKELSMAANFLVSADACMEQAERCTRDVS